MASDVKRVGLVFNADGSTDFVKSLKSVSASLKENYQDFQLVQSQYDENTKTSQKLADKLVYLNSAYDAQKNKVTILSEELKQMESAENADELAITKKRTALKAAESQLNRYQVQIQNVSKEINLGTANLKDYAKKLEETANKVTDVGKKASVLSAGIVGIDVAAANSAMSLETALNKYMASTGATVQETERFKNVLKEIHDENYGEDYADIADKMSLVRQNLGDISDTDLKYITENAYMLQDTFDMDFSETLRGVNGLMRNMGLTAQESFDLITVGARSGLNKTGELGDNLAEYTQIWGQAGFSAKEMFAILDNGLANGAYNLDKVNDFVKEFTISLSDGRIEENLSSFSKDTRKLFNEWKKGKATSKDVFYSVIGDLENMQNQQEALSLASTVWSALGEDNAMKIITSLNDVNSIYDDTANAAKETNDAIYGGTKAKIETIKREFETSLASVGEKIVTNFLPYLETLMNGVDKLLKWFEGLDDSTKNIIITIGLLVAAIGPLLIIFGTMAGSLSKIINLFTNENLILGINAIKKGAVTIATNALKLAQIGLNGVLAIGKLAITGVSTALSFLAANPIVLVISAVAALVAGLVYLWNTNESFRNAIIGIWDGIKNIFMQFNDFLQGIFATDWTNSFGILGNVINGFVANISNFYNALCQIFNGIIDFVTGIFTGNWSLAWEGIKNIFGGIFNQLLALAKAPLNGIIGMLNIVLDGINFLIKGLNKIKFDVPDWVPAIGGKKWGFNLKTVGKIPYMAKGGTLLNGAAIVAEAGPELLLQQGSKTKVIPLNSNSKNNEINSIDNNSSDKNINFNPTININNYSKYIGPAEAARQSRAELRKLILQLKRG